MEDGEMTTNAGCERILGVLMTVALACGPQVQRGDAESGTSSSTGPVATTQSSTTEGPITLTTGPLDPSTSGIDGTSTGPALPEDCSQLEQDCPRGSKCMPYADDGGNFANATRCVPIVPDPNAPGEPCTVVGSPLSGEDDCDGRSMCWHVDADTLQGICLPFCMGTEDEPTCSGACEECKIPFGSGPFVCRSPCDPLLGDCLPGYGCYFIDDVLGCWPDMSSEGVGIGSPCEFRNDCPSGSMCWRAAGVPGCPAGGGCCVPFCTVGDVETCPALVPGTSCMPLFISGERPPEGCLSSPPGVCMQE
jgi:hypothetical protein